MSFQLYRLLFSDDRMLTVCAWRAQMYIHRKNATDNCVLPQCMTPWSQECYTQLCSTAVHDTTITRMLHTIVFYRSAWHHDHKNATDNCVLPQCMTPWSQECYRQLCSTTVHDTTITRMLQIIVFYRSAWHHDLKNAINNCVLPQCMTPWSHECYKQLCSTAVHDTMITRMLQTIVFYCSEWHHDHKNTTDNCVTPQCIITLTQEC